MNEFSGRHQGQRYSHVFSGLSCPGPRLAHFKTIAFEVAAISLGSNGIERGSVLRDGRRNGAKGSFLSLRDVEIAYQALDLNRRVSAILDATFSRLGITKKTWKSRS